MYGKLGFWGRILREEKGKYTILKEKSIFMKEIIADSRIGGGSTQWGAFPNQLALRGYLDSIFIPSMFLKCFNIRPEQSGPNILSPRDILLEKMISQKHYIGVDVVQEVQAFMKEFSEDSKKDFLTAIEQLEDKFNKNWGETYGIFFSLNTFPRAINLQDFIIEAFEYIEDPIEGTIAGIEVLEDQIVWIDLATFALINSKYIRHN